MDAYVQLALIEKAKRVFSDDARVMLSFPLLAPLTFTPQQLSGLTSPQTPAEYTFAADFARLVNFLPQDMLASATERRLWDVYRDVLKQAEVACGDAANAGPTAAERLLNDIAADGTRTESAAMKRYREYRDAWFVARENYASRRLTGELAEDPEVRRRWFEVEEPALKAAVDAAVLAWETTGNRIAIELAIEAERAAALRNPRLRWAEWSGEFDPETDLVTETNGGRYAPTALSPRDFLTGSDWLSFELSAGEVATLVAEAPEQLKSVLGGDVGSRIEHVSFEYRSVAINRPWFRPDVLVSQIWRADSPDIVLSDGADPPQGACPAYATAIVFMRNLQVVERGGGTAHPFTDLRFTVNPAVFTRRRDPRLLASALQEAPRNVVLAAQSTPEQVVTRDRAFNRLGRNSFAVSPAALAATSLPSFTVARRFRPSAVSVATLGLQLQPEVFGTQTQPPPPPPPRRDDSISILAFICKRLPKAPDPDPSLHWQ